MALLSMPEHKRHVIREFAVPDLQVGFQVYSSHGRTVDQGWSYPEHEHPLFELNMCVSGVQRTVINGRNFDQSPGDVLLIRPGDVHTSRTMSHTDLSYFSVHFDIYDKDFFELLYACGVHYFPSTSVMGQKLSQALSGLMVSSQLLFPPTPLNRLKVQHDAISLLSMIWEIPSLTRSDREESAADAGVQHQSGRLIQLREHTELQWRVRELLSEGTVVHDKTLYPRYYWITLVTFVAEQETLGTTVRFAVKNILEDELSVLGIPVILVEDSCITCLVFTRDHRVPTTEAVAARASKAVQKAHDIHLNYVVGGTCAHLEDVHKLYRRSLEYIRSKKEMDATRPLALHHLVRETIEIMNREYSTNTLTLRKVADTLRVHPNYLSALFSSETGATFRKYLTDIRLSKAQELLCQTKMKVYEVCDAVGYRDHAYFCKSFKASVGMSPNEYRDRNR